MGVPSTIASHTNSNRYRQSTCGQEITWHRIASHKTLLSTPQPSNSPQIHIHFPKVQSRPVQSKTSPPLAVRAGPPQRVPTPTRPWKSPSQRPETHYRSALCHGHCTSSQLLFSCLPTRQRHSRYPLPASHQHYYSRRVAVAMDLDPSQFQNQIQGPPSAASFNPSQPGLQIPLSAAGSSTSPPPPQGAVIKRRSPIACRRYIFKNFITFADQLFEKPITNFTTLVLDVVV